MVEEPGSEVCFYFSSYMQAVYLPLSLRNVPQTNNSALSVSATGTQVCPLFLLLMSINHLIAQLTNELSLFP